MAQGFDARQPTRGSFAFQPPAPSQVRTGGSGGSRGAQIVGGESQGGAVMAGQQTDPGAMTIGLGDFFDKLMEPHLQRRQQEEFFRGMTEAQAGHATEEARAGSLSQIFGPTGYQEGAAFYNARQQLGDWQNDVLTNMDAFKRMAPDEAAKALADHSQKMMTGNPFADALIQQGIIEGSAPLLNTVAKERFAWQQQEAVTAFSKSSDTSATTLQQLLVRQSALTAPTDADKSATAVAVQNFARGMAKPEGMTDDSYKKFLVGFMRNQLQAGNFYAVEVMRNAGIDAVLTDDERTRLEDNYQRYGNRALGKAAMTPEIADALIRLDTRIRLGEDTPERITPIEAAAELARINSRIKRTTGLDIDLFDIEDIRGASGSVVDALVAGYRRAEDRRWQIEDREDAQAFQREEREAERQENAAQVNAAWAVGAPETGMAAGMEARDFDVLAINDYRAGDFSRIANSFAREGYVSNRTAQLMQAAITNNMGESYTKDFRRAYGEWSKLNKANGGAAAAYYGQYHVMMQRFDQLVSSGMLPNTAYIRSFGDPAAYAIESIPGDRRKALEDAIPGAINATESWWIGRVFGGRTLLNVPSREVVAATIRSYVVTAGNNSTVPVNDLVGQAIQAEQAAGRLERYGAFAWRNPTGTKALSTLLRLQPREADSVVTQAIIQGLTEVGYLPRTTFDAAFDVALNRPLTGSMYGSLENVAVLRFTGSDGKPMLSVSGFKRGQEVTTIVRLDTIADIARTRRNNEVRRNQPGGQYNGVNAYRRVPGETGLQRTARISREVAEGADPVNHNP